MRGGAGGGGGGGGGGRGGGIQNQRLEPHKKMWGKREETPLFTKNSDNTRGRAICQKKRFYGQAAPSTVAI